MRTRRDVDEHDGHRPAAGTPARRVRVARPRGRRNGRIRPHLPREGGPVGPRPGVPGVRGGRPMGRDAPRPVRGLPLRLRERGPGVVLAQLPDRSRRRPRTRGRRPRDRQPRGLGGPPGRGRHRPQGDGRRVGERSTGRASGRLRRRERSAVDRDRDQQPLQATAGDDVPRLRRGTDVRGRLPPVVRVDRRGRWGRAGSARTRRRRDRVLTRQIPCTCGARRSGSFCTSGCWRWRCWCGGEPDGRDARSSRNLRQDRRSSTTRRNHPQR